MSDPEHTGFFHKVYCVVQQIPYGRVTSYGAIAAFAGSPGAARMVGWALNQTRHTGPALPAHRVLNRNGQLTGKHAFPGSRLMQQLLENEGLVVKDNRVVDFNKHFWDPSRELDFDAL